MATTTDLDDVSASVGAFATQLGNRAIPFAMIARSQVREDAQARVEQAFEKAVAPARRQPGVLAYRPHRDPAAAGGFAVDECWKSLDDLEAHLRTSCVAELRREVEAAMVGAPGFSRLRPL
ncbi:MAG TPA: antibiotic biosynthesis monooxygenase family protein [Xanthobacteraceae bacterium]|nr:antibiotic biosynthesis monooxygenase family protein [Xanthobacteraceae bacterium]